MKTFDVDVAREGRWWMVSIPELDGLTQARRLSEVGQMAREWIALTIDAPLSEIEVRVSGVDVAGLDVNATGDLVAQLREDVRQLEEIIAGLTAGTARMLTSEGVPTRDVAEVLGVSHQRVSQIVAEPQPADAQVALGAEWQTVILAWTEALEPIRKQQAQIQKALEPLLETQRQLDQKLAPLRRQIAAAQKLRARAAVVGSRNS